MHGFVTSSRENSDKIYSFDKHKPKFRLTGFAHWEDSDEGVPDVIVEITEESTGTIHEITKDENGRFEFKLEGEEVYHLLCTKFGCFTRTDNISTKGLKYSEDFHADFIVEEIVIDKPIVLNNIYFDFDEYFIRPDAAVVLDSLAKVLKDNPTIHIEMGSHTDCRGTHKYNDVLSDKRAKSTVDYLIFKGIDESRLTWKGYGETVPREECLDCYECSEEAHQEN